MAMIIVFLLVLFLETCAAEKPRNETDNHRAFPVKNDVIAFSAELSEDDVISAGATLVFDRVITNAGGLYFNTSGQFVCQNGLYVFVWNIAKFVSPELEGMRAISSLRSGGIDQKDGPKSSYYRANQVSGVSEMSAVLECKSNPPTAVTIISKPWTEDIGSLTWFVKEHTSFTGFKLQTGVAFTAELSQDQFAFPGARIMFDKVIGNYGDHYDITSAIFRCPDAGVYVFSVSTHTPDPNTPWSVSRLMVEREVVMQGPMTFIATEDYDSGSASTTAVLQCTPGSSVYVEAQAAHDYTHNSYGAELTSFTGFKLYNVTPDSIAFTVVMSQNFTSADDNDPVLFDVVITNIGGAFDTMNSMFVCPDDSFYLFTWTTVSIYGASYLRLKMDGLQVKRLTSQRNEATSGSCSQTVILQCQQDSELQVVKNGGNPSLLGGYTSFSGYKLPG